MMLNKRILGITLVLLVGILPVSGQISPGDLAEPHAHLEGISNCTKCHTLGDKVSNEKCLDCHKELKVRIDQRKGFHASGKVYKKSCFICHSDHHGRKFDILRFDKAKFDHKETGYVLEGAHKKKDCQECHKKDFISDPNIKKKKQTYLGLNTTCLTCHVDYHQKTLPVKCDNCHNYETFKTAPKFDHAKSKFPLTGSHKDVECKKCHVVKIKNGKEFQEFKGLSFSNCTPCHEDAHQGQFGQNCKSCHSEVSFHQVKNIGSFDHNKTTFPLEGKHSAVDCKKCHKASYTASLRHNRCTDCHIDYHKGDFVKNGITPDCRECHSEKGFPQSSFTIERHNSSTGNFKLEGAHLATPCIACHKKNTDWKFRNIGTKCVDCHDDIHKSYLDTKYYPGSKCTNCHTLEQWTMVKFDHKLTKFPLEGKHSEQTCKACHDQKAPVKSEKLHFTGLFTECTSCHTDEHNAQFEENGKVNCADCHTPEGWKSRPFDHNKSRFKLDGKHINVACAQCHPTIIGPSKTYVLYKTGKIRCENCH